MEDKQLVGVRGGFEEGADRTHSEGTGEELNIKTAAAALRIVLDQDGAGDVVCGERGGSEGVGAKGGGSGLNEGPSHSLPAS